jgi:hypothetical protein
VKGKSFCRPGRRGLGLQGLRQLGSKRTTGLLFAIPSATLPADIGAAGCYYSIGGCGGSLLRSTRCILALWRLRRVGTQKSILERCAIEAADDRLHFFSGRCFDESEAFGFLRFVVADHFDGIGDEVFGGQPLLNIVSCDPYGEVAKKNGKAHSVVW